MLEILALVIVLIALAKPKRRRSFRRYLRGKVQQRLDLGTLAANTLTSVEMTGSVEERTFVSSAVILWGLHDMTQAQGDGPILCGLAHSDYTDTEIEEFIENSGSWSEGDKIAQEKARRKIKIVGLFQGPGGGSAAESVVLNNGKPVHTKLNWILTTGQKLSIWAYNQGDSALATTDPDLTVSGHVNLWPRG